MYVLRDVELLMRQKKKKSREVSKQVIALAEELGRIAGKMEGTAEGWLHRASASEQLTRVRDSASRLLKTAARAASSGRKSAAKGAAKRRTRAKTGKARRKSARQRRKPRSS
jgi:hypothetical protein